MIVLDRSKRIWKPFYIRDEDIFGFTWLGLSITYCPLSMPQLIEDAIEKGRQECRNRLTLDSAPPATWKKFPGGRLSGEKHSV